MSISLVELREHFIQFLEDNDYNEEEISALEDDVHILMWLDYNARKTSIDEFLKWSHIHEALKSHIENPISVDDMILNFE